MRKATGRKSCAIGCLTLLVVLVPLAGGYYTLVNRIPPPLDVPVNLPVPNALDSYLAAGAHIPNDLPRSCDDLDKLPNEKLRRIVNSGQPALSRLRSGLNQSYGVHLHPSVDTLRPETKVIRELGRLQYAEAVSLEKQKQFEASRQAYLRLIEFGAQISHGGMILDALIAMSMQLDGLRGLERLSGRLRYRSAVDTVRALERLGARSAIAKEVILRNNLHEQAIVVELMWIARNGSAKERTDYHMPWIVGWDPIYSLTPKRQMMDAFRRYATEVAAHSSEPYWNRSSWPTPPSDPVNRWVGITYEDQVFKFDLSQVTFRLVEAKLAAHAYQQHRGRQLSWVEDLTPEFLKSVRDPFSGKSLRIKRDAARANPLIYSVGPDKNDDGGQPIKTGIGRTSVGDLVEVPKR